MEATLVALLVAQPALAALDTAGRLKPLRMGQEMGVPCAVFWTESKPAVRCDGAKTVAEAALTVGIYAGAMEEVIDLSAAVRVALDGKTGPGLLFCALSDAGSDYYDEDNRVYEREIRFRCLVEY